MYKQSTRTMRLMYLFFTVAMTIAVTSAAQLMYRPASFDPNERYGSFTKCKTHKQDFIMRWQPKDITFGSNIDIDIDMTPEVTLSSGRYRVSLFAIESPTVVILLNGIKGTFTCDSIGKFFADKICPFRKGVRVQETVRISLDTKIYLEPGDYKIKLEVLQTSGASLICAEAFVTVLSTDDYDYSDEDNDDL